MSHELSTKSKDATTAAAAHKPKGSSAFRRKKERRYGVIVGIGFVVALGLCALTALIVAPTSIFSRSASQPTPAEPGSQSVIGTIIPDSGGGNRCRKMIFDNQTGRSVETNIPCAEVVRDETGARSPVGTIRRLDAISKSFSR